MENSGKKRAYQFILLMGLVSLFGDVTYEGARGASGAYLAFLGARAAAVGLIAGLGEFLGYGLRLVSGIAADRTRAYWPLTILGYGLIFAIPLLGIAPDWRWAAIFLMLERMGKAVRSPARDAILSRATKVVGRGWGFGIHEAMDQIGAVSGPLLLSFFIFHGGYRRGFLSLAIPAALMMAALLSARSRLKEENGGRPPVEEDKKERGDPARAFSTESIRLYAILVFFSVSGFVNFQIIAYHLKASALVADARIPVFYAAAMGIDALAALGVGKLYDRMGLRVLCVLPFLTAPIPIFAFSSNMLCLGAATALWGCVMGIHETVMRAAVAELSPSHMRGMAYGIFNTVYGFSALAGGALCGFLYEFSPVSVSVFVLLTQIGALCVAMRLAKAYRLPS